jgi:alpha-glucosidase (family GH31 glycosyl hydrolase)
VPRRALVLAAAVAVVLTAGAAVRLARGDGSHAPWSERDSPFALQFFRGSTLVGAAESGAAGPGGGFSYTLANGSQHSLTRVTAKTSIANGTRYRVATDERARTATVEVTHTSRGVHVSWHLQPSDDVAVVYSALRSTAADEHFLGTGINHSTVDLAGQIVQLKVSYSCGRSIVTPFYVSSAGYGVYFDTTAVGHIQFRGTHDGTACLDSNKEHALCPLVSAPDRIEACFKASSLAYDVFTGTPVEVVQRYRLTAGRMKLPPVAQFGAIKWRDRVAGAQGVLDDVAQFRRLRIPLGTMLLDNPWEENACWGTLAFDAQAFPHPSALIAAVHRAGAKFMVWVSPDVTTSPACLETSRIPSAWVIPGPPQFGYGDLDLTRPDARAEYRRRVASLVRLGVDGVKGDRGDETDKESAAFAHGSGLTLHNAFPELFARAVVTASASAARPAPLTMFRSGDARTPAAGGSVWTGDQTPDFAGLRDAIRSLAGLGASGFAITGSDVGGYATLTGQRILTPDVFARWTQLGAISPIFEVGGADRAAQFWKLGTAATNAARDSIVLHYELYPYLHGLARQSARTGTPILQPLGLRYPDDPEAWRHDLELLVGPDLLAAPVTNPGGQVDVYLPKGRWVELFSGTTQDGGKVLKRALFTTQFPLYLRAGSTIRFDLRAPLWPRPWPLNALRVPGRAGWLTTASTLDLADAPRESEVLAAREAPPSSVQVDGKSVPRAASPAALAHSRTGWTWVGSPFRGALVKVAPQGGKAHVELR